MKRCLIPECETISNATFTPDWLIHAVPYRNNQPEKCMRYNTTVELEDTLSSSKDFLTKDDYCSSNKFDHSNVIGCSEIITNNNERRLATQVKSVIFLKKYFMCLLEC